MNRRAPLTLSFFLLLLTPFFIQVTGFLPEVAGFENKTKDPFPEFELRKLPRFVRQFDKYYKENFGGREQLFRAYSSFQYDCLGNSPLPQKVLFGKDGWMFLGNDFGDVVEEHMGIEVFEQSELELIAKNLREMQQWLAVRGIKFYLAVAPNKHSVYSEYLPSWVKQFSSVDKKAQLTAHLAQASQVPLIDLSLLLYEHKSEYRLYHKTNTHWNDIGAFLGYSALIARLQRDFPTITPLKFHDFSVDTTISYQEDLTRAIALEVREERLNLVPNYSRQAVEQEKILRVPPSYPFKKEKYEKRITVAGKTEWSKAIYFRDSFCTGMIPFLQEHFSESLFIWDHDFDKELILDEQPDLVVLEIIERDLDALLNIKL